MTEHVVLRCYGELAELAAADRDGIVRVPLGRPRPLDTVVQSVGIPRTEVDLAVVDGGSVGWEEPVASGDRVALYPPFGWLPAGVVSRVRPAPPAPPVRLVADVALAELASLLRELGLHVDHDTDATAEQLVHRAAAEDRVLLTGDREVLMDPRVRHGVLVRSADPDGQLVDVLRRLDHLGVPVTPA